MDLMKNLYVIMGVTIKFDLSLSTIYLYYAITVIMNIIVNLNLGYLLSEQSFLLLKSFDTNIRKEKDNISYFLEQFINL